MATEQLLGEVTSITVEQVQRIVNKDFSDAQATVVKLTELRNHGFSHTLDSKTYVVDLQTPGTEYPQICCCFITISRPTNGTRTYHDNSLPLAAELLTRIRTQTDIPILESTLDTSLELVPYHYLLSPLSPFSAADIVSLPDARRSGALSTNDTILIDLLLGKFMGQLHSGVQNDWFGRPEPGGAEPPVSSYSWQETFTGLLEDLLAQVEGRGLALPYTDVRGHLSRAIGSFLFDDVEVPALVWFTGSEHDIYLVDPSVEAAKRAPGGIAAILPNIAHALWGDPLLECFMMGAEGEGPTDAFLEGYIGGGGGQLTVFPRQKTKRLWYTFFLGLLVLNKYGVASVEGEEPFVEQKRFWAKEALGKCVEALKDAPCY
ncbi:hypothetical protein BDZ94DRAFT_1188423 [Collybia nuda]|uniref:Aminoglycoside phosphotransferase domain-containing protein n=1 Tax=Collybia nuda TaxID=64659 RepID=A0A9P5YBZ8_9AGAR|nr:hypothetical protein BDZ94DRAFT_1188423 [Collybia nuda]